MKAGKTTAKSIGLMAPFMQSPMFQKIGLFSFVLAAFLSGMLLSGFHCLIFVIMALIWLWLIYHAGMIGTRTILLLGIGLALYAGMTLFIEPRDYFELTWHYLTFDYLILMILFSFLPEILQWAPTTQRNFYLLLMGVFLLGLHYIKTGFELVWWSLLLLAIWGILMKWLKKSASGELEKPLVNSLAFFVPLGLFIILVLLVNAWVSEDAFITFRTVDNLVNGHGLTWNPLERVQSYTHPLWMMLVAACYAITHEAYYTSLVLNLVLTLMAIGFLLGTSNNRYQTVAMVIFITFSKGFIDYSTAGLENPLLYLLLVWFFIVYTGATSRWQFFHLSLVAGLAALTRLDVILLFIFPLCGYIWQRKMHWRESIGILTLGFLPFLAWSVFSLIYYGFPFPNTAYAKLNTQLPTLELMAHGLRYFVNSIVMDPITLGVMLFGCLLPWGHERGKPYRAFAMGVAVYYIYLMVIGGDFMSGRFIAIPYLWAVGCLTASLSWGRQQILSTLGFIVLLGIISPDNPWRATRYFGNRSFDTTMIADERGFYYPVTGLLNNPHKPEKLFQHDWVKLGKKLRGEKSGVFAYPNIGMLGYFAGPNQHIVDHYALADPLLARMPATLGSWRIGHFTRMIPAGYLETLRANDGTDLLADRSLGYFYEKLGLIIRGPIWDWQRFRAIWQINLGLFNHFINVDYYQGKIKTKFGTRYFLFDQLHVTAVAEMVQQGVYFALADDWQQAKTCWEKARRLKPENLASYANEGIAAEKSGDLAVALQVYYRIASIMGQPWVGFYLELRDQLPEVARREYSMVFNRPEVRLMVDAFGDTEYDQLVHKAANTTITPESRMGIWSQLQQAQKIDPFRPEAWGNMAILAEAQHDDLLAWRYYMSAAGIGGRPWSIYARVARNKLATNQAPSQTAAGGQAVQTRDFLRCPENNPYSRLVNDGIDRAMGNNWLAAGSYFNQAMALNPSRLEAKANLAIILEIQGQLESALIYYREAAARSGEPWSSYCRDLEQRLKNKFPSGKQP